MVQKIISWAEVRANDLIYTELNDGIVRQVTRREESNGRLFVFLRDMLSTGASSEYSMQVGGTEWVLLVHRPWKDALSKHHQMSKIRCLLYYVSGTSDTTREDMLPRLREAIEDFEVGSLPVR